MKTSEAVNDLVAALAKFQQVVTAPPKNREVEIRPRDKPAYKFSYSELPTILEHIKPALKDTGLSWNSTIVSGADGDHLLTRLWHSSGQWIETFFPITGATDIKGYAGIVTYARRYSVTMLLGIAADDDAENDGKGAGEGDKLKKPPVTKVAAKPPVASKPPVTAPSAQEPPPPADPNAPWKATKADLDRLNALATPGRWTTKLIGEYMVQRYGKAKLSEYTQDQYNELYITVREIDYATAMEQLRMSESVDGFANFGGGLQ